MKNRKFQTNGVVHSVTPFGPGAVLAGVDGLFDDCPICRELRRDLERGEATVLDEESGEDS